MLLSIVKKFLFSKHHNTKVFIKIHQV